MPDMLVKLYDLPDERQIAEICDRYQIEIRRAMTPDRERILSWVRENVSISAVGECAAALSGHPVTCYLATRGAEILGVACYDATAPDFFGPLEVLGEWQGRGIGTALLLKCLYAMQTEGYGYAIIGSVGPVAFYEKTCGAMVIPDSDPGIYKDFLRYIERQ